MISSLSKEALIILPVGRWYPDFLSKPPRHCGSRWSGRSWTPSSPPYLCSTIKSNWWLIISEHTSTEPCPRLPSVHLQDATPPDGPALLWFTRFTRFDCAPGQPSVLETLAPNWRQLSAYWRVVNNQNRLFGGADSACSGAFAYTRKVSKGKRHQESLIIMDGEPDFF